MSNLILFGDSFTADVGVEYAELYKTYEDYHWGEIVAHTYNLNLINLGVGSFSNDRILDKMIENHHTIQEDDIVIIGKTFYNRFDIPNKECKIKDISLKFTTITPLSYEPLLKFGFTSEEAKSIILFLTIVDDKNFIDRTNLRYEFIKKFLYLKKIKNCIFWEVEDLWKNFENIKTATNNKINDNHWSYKGHKDFATYIIEQIEK
jgi:hypothetical protein